MIEIEKDIIDSIKNKLDGLINTSNIHKILIDVMSLIEKTNLKGENQKLSTINILKELITMHSDNKNKTILLELIESDTIGNMIDVIVLGTKNKLDINKKKDIIKKIIKILNILNVLCCKKNKKSDDIEII
tara:strand:- start:3955 stop:4347 length:393 start_codon:yes stop_codon:yes gene_type:complete